MGKQHNDSKVTDKIDLHNWQQRIDSLYHQMKPQISKINFDILSKYDREMVTCSVKKPTRYLHLSRLLSMSKRIKKDWSEVTSEDIKNLVYEIMDTYSDNGEDTEYTADHKKVLKIFFRWFKLGNRSYKTCLKKFRLGDPPETEDITIKKPSCKITGANLISDTEGGWLLQACENVRDRALIAMPLDGGIRPGELLTLKVKDVTQDKYGFVVSVDGKTGKRIVRLLRCTPTLVRWLSEHPLRENPNAPLWVNLTKSKYGQSLSYSAARAIIKRACEKVREKHPEFQKRIFLNLFRHTEATNSAKFMSELITKKRHGWSPSSRMPSRYTHLLDSDVDEILFKHYGIQPNGEDKPKLPMKCSICEMYNPPESKLCIKCGKPLDLKIALEIEEKDEAEKLELRKQLENNSAQIEEMKATVQSHDNLMKAIYDLVLTLRKTTGKPNLLKSLEVGYVPTKNHLQKVNDIV